MAYTVETNEEVLNTFVARIKEALEHAKNGQCDGGHHKAYYIDQITRALLGCGLVSVTAAGYNGKKYTYETLEANETYKTFVVDYEEADPETGEKTYEWDVGIP